MLGFKFAALFLAIGAVAQDTASATDAVQTATGAVDTTAPMATDGATDPNATTPDGSGSSWNNKTYVIFPNREEQGYWVNAVANKIIWNPVREPVDLRLDNSNKELFGESIALANEVPGGQSEYEIKDVNYPVGNNYVVSVWETGTGKKLGQSNGFYIRQNGTVVPTAPAAPSMNAGNDTTATPGATDSTTNTAGTPTSTDTAAPGSNTDTATTAAPSGASRIGGWLFAAVATLAAAATIL